MATDGNPEVNVEMGNHPSGGEEGERVEVQVVDERSMGYQEREIYLQMELYADEEKDSTEIKRKKRMARTALTIWNERIEILQQKKLQMESEMRSTMNEVYNLIGLYSVFVGVVWTAVATSTRLECRHLWSPVGLSLFAYSMLVVVAFKKFRDIRSLEFRSTVWKHSIMDTQMWLLHLRARGYADFDFDEALRSTYNRRDTPLHFWRNALGLIVPLTIFTAGLEFSLVDILCWS